jgi:hypothetical protein
VQKHIWFQFKNYLISVQKIFGFSAKHLVSVQNIFGFSIKKFDTGAKKKRFRCKINKEALLY